MTTDDWTLDAADLADARQDATNMLPLVPLATVQNMGVAQDDGMGGSTPGTPSVFTERCRIAPSSARESQLVARITSLFTWTLTFPALTDVRLTSKIELGEKQLEVIQVLGRPVNEIQRRVIAVEAL